MKNRALFTSIPKTVLFLFMMLSLFSCADFDALNPLKNDLFSSEKDKLSNLRRYNDADLNLPPVVEYIIDFENPMSVKYSNHLKKMCNYTKIPFRNVNVKSWNANLTIQESTRVMCVLETKKLSDASVEKLLKFVSEGGTLFLPFACEDKRFGFMAGMKVNAEYSTDISSLGINFTESFLPTMKNSSVRSAITHYGMSGENFDKTKIKIHATAINNTSFPFIIENKIGEGRVINFNTTFELEKMDRGLLYSGIMMGLEAIPYPVANTNTIFLDDFPSPLYDTKMEPIKSEMNLSISDFVRKIWWPDMKDLAKKYQISYTAVPAFDYNVKTNPPFLFSQWDEKKVTLSNRVEPVSSWLMRDCLKNGHELGFHGYNHVSLIKRDWKKPEFIVTALEGVQKKWKVSSFGDLPVSYVPPSNYIDQMGLKQLKEGLPTINFMCSLYLGETYDGGNREFDFDPYHHNMFDYPRISSGFVVDDNSKYNIHSLYLYSGIWNHFVHPDDVYQIPSPFNKSAGNFELRNAKGLGWRKTKGVEGGLLAEFDSYMKEFTRAFPHSRFLNAGEGGPVTLDWRASKFNHKIYNGQYIVEEINPESSMSNSQYWFLYGTLEKAENIEFQLKQNAVTFSKTPYLNGYLYSVYTNEPKLSLKDYREYREKELDFIFSKIKSDYYTYVVKVREFENGGDSFDNYEEQLRIEKEALKQRMLSESKIDYALWNKYAEYMSWENKQEEIWKMLEKHCSKYPTKENVMYSQELDKLIGYPNDLAMEKWINAQLLVNPRDKDLLNRYVADFNTPENKEKIKQALITLLSVDTGKESIFNYIQHLLWYEPQTALQELEKIQPNADFKELATNITWLYANEKQFQKAYDWSFYSNEIDFTTKMEWLMELKQYDILISEYNNYIQSNPDDYKTKALMSNYYHEMGKFKESWIIANELPDSKEKESLRKMLNDDVVYQDDMLQQDLLQNHSELFYENIKKSLTKTNRLKYGNFIESENELQTNQTRKASLTTRHSYNFYDKKKNLHRIAATYSEFYPLIRSTIDTIIVDPTFTRMMNRAEEETTIPISEQNIFRNVYGIEYQYNNPFSYEKFQYWSRVRLEMDNFNELYMQFGAGISKTYNKNFSSAQINVMPVQTAPGHAKEIYHVRTNLYQSMYFYKKINASLAIESSYYSKSNQNTDFITENNIDITFTLRTGWDNGEEKQYKWVPFLESSLVRGSTNLDDGYPYWMLDKRFFGGGGISFSYGLEKDDFKAKAEAAYFLDDYSEQFQRFSGTVSYRLFNYTALVSSFEIFNQDKFYSNTIQFGLKHSFKEKKKK